MVGQNLKWVLGPALLVLGVHLVSVALTKALRCYSRSRLEDLCLARGHARRADDVIHHDEATEDAAEALAVLTGLGLAALLAALASGAAPLQTGMLVIVSALIVSVPGYFLAGAIGQVYAESVIDRLWPVARPLRLVTTPLRLARRLSETVVAHLAPTRRRLAPAGERRGRAPFRRRRHRGGRGRASRIGPRADPANHRADPARRLGADDAPLGDRHAPLVGLGEHGARRPSARPASAGSRSLVRTATTSSASSTPRISSPG